MAGRITGERQTCNRLEEEGLPSAVSKVEMYECSFCVALAIVAGIDERCFTPVPHIEVLLEVGGVRKERSEF